MTNLQELETRRDRIAGTVAELQQALDELNGSEELTAVQRMTNDLDASTRLLAALDRQLTQVYEQQRAQVRAETERRRAQAAQAAAKIDDDVRALLYQVYDLVTKREDVTSEFSNLAITSSRMRSWAMAALRDVGVDFAVSVGNIQPVRR